MADRSNQMVRPGGPSPLPVMRGNPDVSNTAARHVAKAMTRCNVHQRREMLEEIIKHALVGLDIIDGRPASARRAA